MTFVDTDTRNSVTVRRDSGAATTGGKPWPEEITSPDGIVGGSSVGCRHFIDDRQQQAAFKDIPFMVDVDDWSGGRRIVNHQFPSREFWLNEDLGQTAVRVTVRAYVYGDNVERWAMAVFEACSSYGAGDLVLPFRPKMRAFCTDVRTEFVADAMGRMPVNMEFVLEHRPEINDFNFGPSISSSGVSEEIEELLKFSAEAVISGTVRPSSAYAAAAREIKRVGRAIRRIVDETPLYPEEAAFLQHRSRVMIEKATNYAYSLRKRANALRPLAYGGGQEEYIAYVERHDYIDSLMVIIRRLHRGAVAKDAQDELAKSLNRLVNMQPNELEDSQAYSAILVNDLVTRVVAYARRIAVATQASLLLQVVPSDVEKLTKIAERIVAMLEAERSAAADVPRLHASIEKLIARWNRHLSHVYRKPHQKVALTVMGPLAPVAGVVYGGTELKGIEYDRQLIERNSIRHPLYVQQDITAVVTVPK